MLLAANDLCGNDLFVGENVIHVKSNSELDELSNDFNINVLSNPFDINAYISFYLTKQQHIKISLFDIVGKEIVLSDMIYAAGKQQFVINSNEYNLSKGLYILKFSSKSGYELIKLIKY